MTILDESKETLAVGATRVRWNPPDGADSRFGYFYGFDLGFGWSVYVWFDGADREVMVSGRDVEVAR